jgi:uncharacterized membrane protein
MTAPQQSPEPDSRRGLPANFGAKLFELSLLAAWFCFVFLARDERSRVGYLGTWDLIAATYLTLGFIAIWRRGGHSRPTRRAEVMPVLRPLVGPRFEFACVLAASVAGLTSAVTVLGTKHADLQVVGALAIALSWILLHAGYARFYAGLSYLSTGRRQPLEFPASGRLTSTDFFYFAFTVGTTFAASDVRVTTSEMRRYVMVHSVLSFFFNAAVLAVAVKIILYR